MWWWGTRGREESRVQKQAPRLRSPTLPPAGTARRGGPRGGDRGGSWTRLTWSSRNSNRWALKLSIWKSQFCIKPSKLPSSTSTRSPSSRPWPSRSQLRALLASEGQGAGREPQSSGQTRERLQAVPGRAEQLQRAPRPVALPSGPSERGAGAHARGAAARRARGSGSPRRTQLGQPAPVRLQGAGRGASGRALGRDTKAKRRLGGGGGPPSTIDPGGRAAARARGRRFGAVPCPGARSAVRGRRGASPGAQEPPQSSRLPARGAGRRGSVLAAGAGCARAFVCGEGAGTSSARVSSPQPAPPSPPRRVSSASALSEHYKRGAPPHTAQPIGPPLGSR